MTGCLKGWGLQVNPVAPIRFEQYKSTWDAITPAHPVPLHKKVGVGLGARLSPSTEPSQWRELMMRERSRVKGGSAIEGGADGIKSARG
jgi:hypothetical protein